MANRIMTEKVGHRQRLRERFLAGGPEECSDEMLLELLLTFSFGRKDVSPIVQKLLQIFCNFDHVLSAPLMSSIRSKGSGRHPL